MLLLYDTITIRIVIKLIKSIGFNPITRNDPELPRSSSNITATAETRDSRAGTTLARTLKAHLGAERTSPSTPCRYTGASNACSAHRITGARSFRISRFVDSHVYTDSEYDDLISYDFTWVVDRMSAGLS